MNQASLEKELKHLESLAEWMDNRFTIPGTSIKFGLDSVLGLIPGIGDSITVLATLYLTHRARQYNLPHHIYMQMYWNAFIDWAIGLVPLIGDVFDVKWKANMRNVDLIKQHLKGRL